LQAAIGLSDATLDDSARRTFHALSVFPPKPNTFSEEAALAVTDEPPEALDALVDAGLLEVADGRYTLHPVMRDYAATTTTACSEGVQARMLTFYIQLIETDGLDASISAAENENIQAALDLAASSLLCNTTLNRNESLAAEKNGFISSFTQAIDLFFPMLEAQGLYRLAERHLNTALHLARQSGDSVNLTPILFRLGQLSLKAANVNEAREYFESSLQYARHTDNLKVTANVVRHLGDLAFETGEYEDADIWYREGLAIADQQRDPDHSMWLTPATGRDV
jgi:tetratricopeptide (TPR) repeat protein